MTNFLLIHGAQHGKWCWEALGSALSARGSELNSRGSEVHTLDLPGHGDDPAPRAEITLESYVNSVTSYIDSHGLEDITLVGHSFAGVILPEICSRRGRAITGVVFLAAYVLEEGEAFVDLAPEQRRPKYFEMAAASEDNTLSFDYDLARKTFFNTFSEGEVRRYFEMLTPEPFGPCLEKARISAGSLTVRKRYILCLRDQTIPPELCRSFAGKLGVVYEEIDAGHEVMLSHPVELAEMLLGNK